MCKKPHIVAVVGPTASGKTALAVALAKRLSGEVISCDSMQIYRGMQIGTAKPTPAEMQGVPHHLFDIADVETPFSAEDYRAAAHAAVKDVLSRGRLPIICGGTGLYLDALLRGADAATPAGDPAIREELSAMAAARGEAYLHSLLAEVDPKSAAATPPHNLRRVIRALEIYRTTGKPKSEWDEASRALPPCYDATVLGLDFKSREVLYDRIERRVDAMMAEGLLNEARGLYLSGVLDRSPTAAAAIGYKELLPHIKGECSLEECVAVLKRNTRRYAKRQLTWFRAKPFVHWLTVDDENGRINFEQIVNNAVELCERDKNMI